MSIHKSLRTGGNLIRARNVLTRYERILELRRTGRWTSDDDTTAYGLPKVRVMKIRKRVKAKKKEEAEGEVAASAES